MAWIRNLWRVGGSRHGVQLLRDHHGFTVIDLIVGVAIIGILAAVAVPNLQPLMTRYRLDGATRQVMGDLMAARMKAVSQHRPYRIFFSESQAYTICDDANEDGIVDNGEGAALVRDVASSYAGVSVSATTNPMFTATGTATGNTTITITNAHGSKTIAVSRTGQVKIN